MSDMIRIRNLVGHSQVNLACQCLGSLLKHCKDSVVLTIHDDGTLTPADIDRLTQVLNSPEIISRKTADDKILPLLQNFPACMKYREEHPLGLKLFDVCLLHDPDETLYFCDSDVLFLRPFRFPRDPGEDSVVFMKDFKQAFALHPWHIKPLGPVKVRSHVNTGLIIARMPVLDLKFIESLLSKRRLRDVLQQRPYWVEQTCWAALATRLSTYLFDEAQVCLATPQMDGVTADQVAIHFTTPSRKKLAEFLNHQVEDDGQVCTLRIHPAENATVQDIWRSDPTILRHEISRRLKRRK
jgi:hypothetical protein